MYTEKLIIGNFVSFAEAGKTIDAVIVSAAAFPDDSPTTNWDSIGCVQETDFEVETETDTDYCPKATGGYAKEETLTVVKDIIKFKVRESSELFMRMALGFASEIVDETAQMPFAETERYIQCWLKVTGVNQSGESLAVMKVWGKLRIDGNPKWSKDPTKPGYKFEVEYSAIATATPDNIVA